MNPPMNPQDLRTAIRSTLIPMGLYNVNAEELMMATCANESNLGEYRTQVGSGPARGIFQMEGEDHDDIWNNYLKYHMDLYSKIHQISGPCTADDMINNDPYAIVMCRVHYMRKPGNLPDAGDIEGIWAYYKQWYNTPAGGATHDQFIQKYNKFVLGN
jgi:hypothetical protein